MNNFNFIKIPNQNFEIQTTQVTQELWQGIMGNNPSYFKGNNLPVESVSWDDCQVFIKKLNEKQFYNKLNTLLEDKPLEYKYIYRLPTEAEWEIACKGGNDNDYCFGNNEKILKDFAWYEANANNSTMPVAQLKPNAFGLYDMHGNVWEWCEDLYTKDTGSLRVVRGGCWGNYARSCRSAFRSFWWPGGRDYSVGFRLARTKVNYT